MSTHHGNRPPSRIHSSCHGLASLLGVVGLLCLQPLNAQVEPPPRDGRGQPNRDRPGPWDNDVLVFRAGDDGKAEKIATFPRAGVPTLTRLVDGRLAAAHQHFPADSETDFDKVAVRFSSDEGRTWTEPQVIQLTGLPEGMRFPFDPTLVPLPDGRLRLYFTSLKGRRLEADRPAIYSAISSNGVEFAVEPGLRFGLEDRPVIDCAVVLHKGVFHLFAPDNGAGNNPGARPRDPAARPREGTGYHATSKDGLDFTRQPDVQLDGPLRWLGNVQADGEVMRFFGTGGPDGIWTATSADGQSWKLDDGFPPVMGADPGAVKLKDGGWLLAVTGPPRQRRPQPGPGGPQQPRQPLAAALDANDDGTIDEWELENAPALLRKLDRDGDGRLTQDELRPSPRGQPPRGPRPLRDE